MVSIKSSKDTRKLNMSSQEERNHDPLMGKKVKTLSPIVDDWTYENQQARQWGVKGKVIDLSNAHGLCYQIQHEDLTCAWYDPKEFVEI